MRIIVVGFAGLLIPALACEPAAGWSHANRYGGSSAFARGQGAEHTNAWGGSSAHAYGGGTEHTNVYGGSTEHRYGEGTEHTNMYGGQTAHAYGAGTEHTYASGAAVYHPRQAMPRTYPLNAIYATLPAGCNSAPVKGATYYFLAPSTWFQASFGANGVYYRVVSPP